MTHYLAAYMSAGNSCLRWSSVAFCCGRGPQPTLGSGGVTAPAPRNIDFRCSFCQYQILPRDRRTCCAARDAASVAVRERAGAKCERKMNWEPAASGAVQASFDAESFISFPPLLAISHPEAHSALHFYLRQSSRERESPFIISFDFCNSTCGLMDIAAKTSKA